MCGSRVHCSLIFIFPMSLFLTYFFFSFFFSFAHGPFENVCSLSKSIWALDGTLTGTTTPGQSGPGSNVNKVVLGGARGVMVIVIGNGHGDTSSNPGRDW